MGRQGMTRRRFLARAAAAAAGFTILGLGVQCGATPTPEVTEVVPTEVPVVKETSTPAWEGPERILFVGDNMTLWNKGVDTHVRSLAASRDPPLAIETSRVADSGSTLRDHYTGSLALKEIREGGWDVVVLQEGIYAVVDSEEDFYEYAAKLDAEIKKVGAQTVFFMAYEMREPTGRVIIPTEVQERAYNNIGAELGARVAPVGLAWERSIQENPELLLYDDQGHSSIYGTYLNACVFYVTLFGESPAGLSYKPIWATDEEATFLQRIAWETVQEYEQPAAD